MNSPIQLYRAVLKTGNKTPKDIRKILEAPTDNEINRWIAAYNLINGLEVLVMECAFVKDSYTIAAYNPDNDEQFKEFHYQMEQETNDWFGPYSGDRKAFMEDWKNGEYEASGSFVFEKDEIEIIEKCEKKPDSIKICEKCGNGVSSRENECQVCGKPNIKKSGI